jgi:hypothetical protein
MSRGLDVSQINASMSSHRVVAPLVELLFDSGTLRFTPWRWDITVGAVTYLKAPIAISKVRESSSSAEGMQLQMNGLDPAILTIAANENWKGRICRLLKAYIEPNSNQLIGTPKVFFPGRMHNWIASENNERADITVIVEHYDLELERDSPSRFSDADQQRFFPGDLGCQFAAANSEKQVVWPSVDAQKHPLKPHNPYQTPRRYPRETPEG